MMLHRAPWFSTCMATGLLGALAACSGVPTASPLSAPLIASILAAPERSAADRQNDVRRKPAEMLTFIGLRPGMRALDLSAGGGYTSELLARAVGPSGEVWGQSAPRNPATRPPAAPEGQSHPGPATPPPAVAAGPLRLSSPDMLAQRSKNAGLSHLQAVVRPFEDPVPPELTPAKLDLVTLMFNYHDLGHMGVDRMAMNRAVFAALKPGGQYVIADHAGRPGTGISEAGTLHRVEEAFVVQEVQGAGFKLTERGNFLRNPNDPRDKNTPEPAQPKDEFVLKFVKP